ncbi:unnamed protein product [Amaranthus hypochondriacus]
MVRMNWNIRQQAQATLTVQQKQDYPILNQKQKEQAASPVYQAHEILQNKTVEVITTQSNIQSRCTKPRIYLQLPSSSRTNAYVKPAQNTRKRKIRSIRDYSE